MVGCRSFQTLHSLGNWSWHRHAKIFIVDRDPHIHCEEPQAMFAVVYIRIPIAMPYVSSIIVQFPEAPMALLVSGLDDLVRLFICCIQSYVPAQVMYCCLKQYKGLTLKFHSHITLLFRCPSITFLNLFDIIETLKFRRFGPVKLLQMIYVGIWNTFRKGFMRSLFKPCKCSHCYDYASNDWIMQLSCCATCKIVIFCNWYFK